MIFTLYQIIRTARPRQWLKNLSVFAAPLFAGTLFNIDFIFGEPLIGKVFAKSISAFLLFCAMSSGAYFINDIIDSPKDKNHPVKKNRPIASGKLSIWLAWLIAGVLVLGSIYFASVYVGTYFALSLIVYILMQMSYSLYFRNIIILDSLVVATGFVIRVFAGAFASATSISSWLALTTIGISLLLAFGKRRSEKTIMSKFITADEEATTRKTLRHYPDALLDSMISMSATYTIITYSLFTFQISPQSVNQSISVLLPSILKNPKWMMLTIPFVIYGVARYLYIMYEKDEGESPERVFLSDKPLLFTVILWGICVLSFIYIMPVFS